MNRRASQSFLMRLIWITRKSKMHGSFILLVVEQTSMRGSMQAAAKGPIRNLLPDSSNRDDATLGFYMHEGARSLASLTRSCTQCEQRRTPTAPSLHFNERFMQRPECINRTACANLKDLRSHAVCAVSQHPSFLHKIDVFPKL
mmetsp:Transcript_20448/g.49077  ORF Transcript_20448/g.49077 Transcript_20448/m.49077 type:complete len:144 (-) Transcript_20448:541-972(-)